MTNRLSLSGKSRQKRNVVASTSNRQSVAFRRLLSFVNFFGIVTTLWLCGSSVGTAAACRGGTIIRSGISAYEKNQILESHNRLRQTVAQGRIPGQPAAENMQEMIWDEELASRAQTWANECVYDHDPSRYLDRFIMGQNLAIIWSTVPLAENDGDFPSRIQKWFNEVSKYAWGARWSPTTGHYSQLVWGDTNLIGCGFSYYQDANKFNKLYVCNYGPGGNVLGAEPYTAGNPSCSNYGMIPSRRYNGLCAAYAQTRYESNYIQSSNNFFNDLKGVVQRTSQNVQKHFYTAYNWANSETYKKRK